MHPDSRAANPAYSAGLSRRSRRALQARQARALGRPGKPKLLLATALLLSSIGAAAAHTVSVGYEALGGGVFDIWYGTYHAPSQANYTEGALQFVGPSVSTTVSFTMLVTTKPGGLVDGQTNFYSNAAGTALTGTPVAIGGFNGTASGVLVWQGAQFTGITRPGTYTFTYIPIMNPTAVWQPISDAILTGSFTVTAQALGTTLTSLLPSGSPTNVLKTAAALDGFVGNGGTLPDGLQSLYNLTPAQLSAAMSELSGEASVAGPYAAMQFMDSFLSMVLNPYLDTRGGYVGSAGPALAFAPDRPLAPEDAEAYAAVTPKGRGDAPPRAGYYGSGGGFDNRWSVWGSAFGANNKTGGDSAGLGTHGTSASAQGFGVGLDYRATADSMIGFALAEGATNYGLSDGLGGGHSNVLQSGVYGSYRWGNAYLSGALAYGYYRMSTDRMITIAGSDTLTAGFDAQNWAGRVEGGYRFNTAWFAITPYSAYQPQAVSVPSYSESALSGSNTYALSYQARTATMTRVELGSWFDKTFTVGQDSSLALRARAAWAYDHSSDPIVAATFQSLQATSFTVNGAGTVPDLALVSAGAEWRWRNISLAGRFDGEFADRSQTYAGTATLRYLW